MIYLDHILIARIVIIQLQIWIISKNYSQIHITVITFECTTCEKGSTYKGHMENRQSINIGEKPYKYSQCDICFTKSDHLVNHQRTHTVEKPYKSSLCSERFSGKTPNNTYWGEAI